MKKGQLQLTFNWVYVLIAGALILLFFVGIVIKQKDSSEKQLAVNVIQVMETIFTSAGVSEKTKNLIDTSGLTEYTFYFDCQEMTGEYGIKGNPARVQNLVNPVFSPKELQTAKMITWSLPYNLPYKVIDLLFVTSTNTKYVFLGNSPFGEEFIDATEDFNVVEGLHDFVPGKNFQVRVVDLDGTNIKKGELVEPQSLRKMDRVSAVQFESASTTAGIFYYKKDKQGKWQLLNKEPLPMVAVDTERNAAKFAAVFSADDQQYWCNMQKVFKRLNILNSLYLNRLQDIKEYYLGRQQRGYRVGDCLGYIGGFSDNLEDSLRSQSTWIEACSDTKTACRNLLENAPTLRKVNEMMSIDCISLY